MYKIAVCDDSPIILRQLAQYFEQLQKELPEPIAPCYYTSAEELLSHMAPDTDLLLLDIQMSGMNGMACAKLLRQREMELPIIFITNMLDFALEGYEVHAFAFLPKPVTYDVFSRTLREAFEKLSQNKPKNILLNTGEGILALDISKLIYVEVYQHKCSFVMTDERADATVQLAAVEPLLLPHGFFRCHRSYLVGYEQITHIGADSLTMKNGDSIPLSKHRRKEFLDCYSHYMGGRVL